MNKFICLCLFALPLIGKAQSTHTIYASDYNIFSPSELTIQVNDTVYFENLTLHNAVEVDEETYNNNGTKSNGGFSLQDYGYVVFNEAGTYFYVCTPHVMMGMKGYILVEGENNPLTHTIDDYTIELSDLSTVSDFYQNTYYNALEACDISWQIVEVEMPNEWEFSVCFPSCYNPGVMSGTANFSASTNQYLNCHFYPNNTVGQGVVKMEITTNSNTIDTVVWIGTAVESINLETYHLFNTNEIEGIYSLDGRKVDQILTNSSVFIRYKSGLVRKFLRID
ncbi:plastocyanin/azurin family copper-binding protein [Flavobacteriales bacterium]|nr:plastocyanin/azurin family copper-binding protein [Flavobacteriales bacterium]